MCGWIWRKPTYCSNDDDDDDDDDDEAVIAWYSVVYVVDIAVNARFYIDIWDIKEMSSFNDDYHQVGWHYTIPLSSSSFSSSKDEEKEEEER